MAPSPLTVIGSEFALGTNSRQYIKHGVLYSKIVSTSKKRFTCSYKVSYLFRDCGRDKWCCTDDTDVTAPLPTPAHPADGGATPAAGTGERRTQRTTRIHSPRYCASSERASVPNRPAHSENAVERHALSVTITCLFSRRELSASLRRMSVVRRPLQVRFHTPRADHSLLTNLQFTSLRCVVCDRPGGDLSRGHITESGLYCGGALVGPRVVLTSASCIATVGEESVWARVPASAAPARRYSVLDRLRHAGYNSGELAGWRRGKGCTY